MRHSLLSGLLMLLVFGAASAQSAKVHRYTTPIAGKVVLGNVEDKYNAEVYSLMPETESEADKEKLRAVKAQIKKLYPYKKQEQTRNKKTTALSPIVNISYVADSLGGIPSDNYMAISHADTTISVINSTLAIHDGHTGHMVKRKGLQTFAAAAGLNNINHDYKYDPKIVYDPTADRYICIMLNSTNQYNYIVIGFSNTDAPSGAWTFYKFYGDYKGDTTWFDYPAISITQNELFFTGNKIKYDSSWQAGFKETVVYQIRKQDGYDAAASLSYQLWDSITYNGNYIRCLYPLNPGGALQAPSQYFLSDKDFAVQNDTIFLVKIPDTIGSGNTNLTVTALAADLAYGIPPDGRQPDTSRTLATNDNRVLGGYIQGNEIQFVLTSLNPASGGSAIYHGIISNYNASPTVHGQIWGIDTFDLGYPNISYTGNQGGTNQSIISFDYSGPHTYPGFGAIFFDGTQYSDMVNIRSGDSCINMLAQKEQRWGDYSGSQPDWNAIGAVWVEGIYGRRQKNYGNYIAELSSPYFNEVPEMNQAAASATVYPNPAWQFVRLEFDLPEEDVFSFVIYDAQGRMVDRILQRRCDEGRNIVQFNTAPLLAGTYFLKAMNNDGKVFATKSFVKQ